MAVSLKGDVELKSAPTPMQKALKINLNKNIYGSFSEIGAGQETARSFFRAGASSGT
ncbi:MAG TPA: TonB-dependent receptor, partial [Flavobacteriales bacterium]|nr:TonB-dependent receptor [Flavobacteriales bacterium]